MAWKAKPIGDRLGKLKNFTAPVVEIAASGFADQMREDYKEGRRSGSKDYRTGKRRSVLGEWPQEQTGQLRSAITYKVNPEVPGGLSWLVGLDASKAIRSSMKNQAPLEEYLGYIEGYDKKVAASRNGLEMTAEAADTAATMRRTLAKLLASSRFAWGR